MTVALDRRLDSAEAQSLYHRADRVVLGAVIGTWLGRATGIEQAFPLRFQAQQLLIQAMDDAPSARRFA
jgi:hypothetical protein